MSIALDQAINYRSKYELTVESKTLAPKKNKGYSRSRNVFHKVVNIFLVLSIVVMGLVGFSGGNIQKANAVNMFDFDVCDVLNTNGVWFQQGAPVYMGAIGTPSSGKITAYEKFGTAGTEWTVWRGPVKKGKGDDVYKADGSNGNPSYDDKNAYHANGVCMPAPEILTAAIANPIFGLSKITVFVSGLVYQTAFEGKSSAITPMQKQISTIITGADGTKGLKDTLYLDFLIPIIMLSALYIGYIGLFKRRSTEAMSSAGWMIGSAVVGLFLLINPMLIPNSANKVVNSVTEAVMTGITSSATNGMSKVGSTDSKPSELCTVEGDGDADASNDQQRRITRVVQCSLWYSFIYVPWATGQYGVSPVTTDENSQRMLTQYNGQMKTGVSLDASGSGRDIQNVTWPIYQINAQVMPGGNLESRDKLWVAIPRAMLGEPSANSKEVVNTAWKGDPTYGLISKAIFSLIASVGSGIMIISLGMSMIVFEIGLVILMLLAPLFLLVGVHPGFGRRIALKWLETIISLTMKRIVLSILLGVMVTFYGIVIAIPEKDLPWFGTVILIIAISLAGMKYKDTVTEMFGNINLGGGGPIKEPESKMGGMAKGALAAGAGAAIGSVLAGRAASTASVVSGNNPKAGEDSKRDGTGGQATQRAKGSETLGQTEGLAGGGFAGGRSDSESVPDVTSGPSTSRATPAFDSVADEATDGLSGNKKAAQEAMSEVAEGLAGDSGTTPKRREIRTQREQQEALAAASAKREVLEKRLNKKFAKQSNMATMKNVSGAMLKGAFLGANGGDVSFIAQTAQANAGKAKLNQRRGLNSNINEAKTRQTEYSSAWEAYNSAGTQAEKDAAALKIKSTYGTMTAKEKSYLRGVGKVNNQVDKAMGLPKKPAQPATPGEKTDKKVVAPQRKHVNPNHSGGLPRRPQP